MEIDKQILEIATIRIDHLIADGYPLEPDEREEHILKCYLYIARQERDANGTENKNSNR